MEISDSQNLLEEIASCPAGEKVTHGWAAAHRRMLGYIRYRFRKNTTTIWHRLRPGEFLKLTGLSLRTYRNALDRLRSEEDFHGLKFRTVFKRDGGKRGSWIVLVAEADQLLFDQEPLFRDDKGRTRHVRPHLHEKKIQPPPLTYRWKARDSSREARREQSERSIRALQERRRDDSAGVQQVSAAPYKGGSQQNTQRNSARAACREVFRSDQPPKPPQWTRKPITRQGARRLRGRAAHLASDLMKEHWDNCRVVADRDAALGWIYKRLREGFRADRIFKSYKAGLRHAHAIAVDFEESSIAASYAFAEARRTLWKDGKSERSRILGLYHERREARIAFDKAMKEGTPLKSES